MIKIRDDLKGFEPYFVYDTRGTVKLDANESPFTLSEKVKNRFIEWFKDYGANRYPNTDSNELREALAKFYSLSKENFVIGVGSDQVLDFVLKGFVEAGDMVMTIAPTFSMYKITTEINHGKIFELALDDDFTIDANEIIKKANEINPKVLIICSPNNPTGISFSTDDILKIVKNVNCLTVIDEAYSDFSGETVIDEVKNFENLLVSRTFSKSFGLAGIRCGYAISNENVINILHMVKPPENLPEMSEKIALFALMELDEYKERVNKINELRDELFDGLKEFEKVENLKGKFEIFKSKTNFILLKSDPDLDFYAILKENGITVRQIGAFNNKIMTRITVGTKEENEKVLEVLRRVL